MKKKTGIVISDKMNKAAVVLVERRYRHPLYGKIIRSQRKIHVANEIGAKVGQKVLFVQTRPISKTIAFKIVEVVK
jgi:small subunit ribosomal protein S17